jgi:hypothetical protein
MTLKERDAIEKLRDSVERYTQEVIRLIESHGTIRRDVDELKLLVKGNPEDAQTPGVIAQVQSLVISRSYARWAGNAAWAVTLIVLGACLRQLIQF